MATDKYFIGSSHGIQAKNRELIKRQMRLQQMIAKAAEFHRIEAGWYFGGGQKISSDVIGHAIWLMKLASESGLTHFNVFPRAEGGIRIDFYEGEHEIEVSLDADGTCSFLYEADGETLDSQNDIRLSDTATFVRAVAKKICTSERFTPGISTIKRGDSAQLRVSRPVTVGYLSFWKAAQPRTPDRYVLISGRTASESHQTHPFTGGSTSKILHLK